MANAGAKLSSFPEVNDIQTGDMFPLLSGGNTNAKIDYATLARAIIAKEVERATAAENKLESEKADKTLATAFANGLMSAADKKAIDREFFRLLPKGGTYIPAKADLNSIEYLKVGNYYNSSVAESGTIKNIPIQYNNAFIMYVLSPLSEVYDNESTAQWVYRLRIFITYTGNEIFVQKVSSGTTAGSFTYDPWVKMTNSNDLGAASKIINDHIANKSNPHAVTKAQVGLGSVANLDQSKAIKSITRSGTTFTATALDGTKTTFSRQEEKSVTAGIVTVEDADGGDAGLTLNLEPHQSGSGDPSPTNIRPISGWNSVKMTRAGKNVFPPKGLTQTLNGITIHSNDDGSFTVNGTATATAQFDLTLNNELKLQSGQYTVDLLADKAVTFDGRHVWWFFYNTDARVDIVNGSALSKTFTINAVTTTRFYLRIISGTTVDNVTLYPMLVYGSDAPTEFEPYNGNTYNISLSSAGTVYGGSLDVTSGKLVVDRVGVTISDLTWTYDSSNTRFTTSSITNVIQKPSADNVLLAGLMSSAYTARAATQLAANDGSIGVLSNGQLLIKDTNYTAASNFVSAMGAQSIVYPLATPRTYQLTPTEVTMLIGHNTIWMDAEGTIKLDYKTNAIATKGDVNEAIARIKALAKIAEAIAPVESSYTATQNYSVGDYLIVDYELYKVTAAIANGGTIAVGTNVTATTIMAEIKALT